MKYPSLYLHYLRENSVLLNIKTISEVTAIFFLKYWLLIDMANGYMMRNAMLFPGGFSLGELSRIGFLIVFLISFKIKKNKLDLLFILTPFLLLSMSLAHYIIMDAGLVKSINISVKLSLPIFIFLFVKENLNGKRDLIIKILKLNSFILIFNLLISLFGIGFFSYGSSGGMRFGGKGFFFAGNEVSGVIIATYALFVYLYKSNAKKVLIVTFIYLFISLISLTRSSIFGVFIIFVTFILVYKKENRILFIAPFFILMVGVGAILREYIMLAINRASFFIDKSSMLIFMTGGEKRWAAASDYFDNFLENPLFLFVGSGWVGLAEQDLVDLIDAFGMFGVLLYLIWFYFAAYTYKNQERRSDKIFVIVVFLILLGVATIAGHIIYSAMLAPFIALLANLHLLKNNNKLYYTSA